MILQISCRAKGVFHVTVPAPPKVSIFKAALEAPPSVSVSEDSTESQSFIIALSPEAFQQQTTQGVVQKTCSEILTVTSSDQTMVLSSSIAITDAAGGCQISFAPIPNAAGDLQFIASSTANPSDQFNIPITITNTNDAPTDISLSNLSMAENAGANAVVGSLSATDPDLGDTFTYSLAAGAGSTDNTSFNISATQLPNQLQMTSPADFETKSSYSIRLRVTDQGGLFFEKQFTIIITNVNEAPTFISLSNLALAENVLPNALVGNLSATDPDLGNTFTYSLVAGTGSTDNASFTILGSQLRMSASPDFETKSSYGIRIRVRDQGGLVLDRLFTITITNVNEAPTDLSLSSLSLAENSGPNAFVASLSATDPDLGDTFTYNLAAGAGDTDNASFNISTSQLPNQLQMTSSADFETKSSYSVRLRVTDQGGLFFEMPFSITITNVNEAPSNS